jgi:peptidyl-prolyl cis-trans isomerase SurA
MNRPTPLSLFLAARRHAVVGIAAALALAFCLASPRSCRAELVDVIAAVVEGKIITKSEVDTLASMGGGSPSDPAHWEEAREALIDRALVESEAAKRNIAVTPAEVDAASETVRRRMNLDALSFLSALAGQGMTLEQYRDTLRSQILERKLADAVMREEYRTSDALLQAFYLESREAFREPPWVRLLHLTLPAGADRGAAEKLRTEAASGGDLEERARTAYGALVESTGILAEADLAPALREAVAGLTPGQVSAPVEIDGTFHLFRLEEKGGGLRPFEEVREEVEREFSRRGYLTMLQSWLERRKQEVRIERIR